MALSLWQLQAWKSSLSVHLSHPSPGHSQLPWGPLRQPSAHPPWGMCPWVPSSVGKQPPCNFLPPPCCSPSAEHCGGQPGTPLLLNILCDAAQHGGDPSMDMAQRRLLAPASPLLWPSRTHALLLEMTLPIEGCNLLCKSQNCQNSEGCSSVT